MEAILMKVFTESGTNSLLLVMIIGGFIWKGIPYIVSRFDAVLLKIDKIVDTFKITMDEAINSHRRDMDTISGVFIAQIKESNSNHSITQEQLKELKEMISKL
jgi:hypothetical protein